VASPLFSYIFHRQDDVGEGWLHGCTQSAITASLRGKIRKGAAGEVTSETHSPD